MPLSFVAIIGIAVIIFGAIMRSAILITLGVNLIVAPISYIGGTLLAGGPDATIIDFFKGFLTFQLIPLLFLIFFVIRRSRKILGGATN